MVWAVVSWSFGSFARLCRGFLGPARHLPGASWRDRSAGLPAGISPILAGRIDRSAAVRAALLRLPSVAGAKPGNGISARLASRSRRA
jgi:hypothetical protein